MWRGEQRIVTVKQLTTSIYHGNRRQIFGAGVGDDCLGNYPMILTCFVFCSNQCLFAGESIFIFGILNGTQFSNNPDALVRYMTGKRVMMENWFPIQSHIFTWGVMKENFICQFVLWWKMCLFSWYMYKGWMGKLKGDNILRCYSFTNLHLGRKRISIGMIFQWQGGKLWI